MVVPPVSHPIPFRIFHEINHPAIGVPPFMETPIDSTIVEHRSGGMFSAEIWCNSLLHWIISKYQPQIAATLSKSFIDFIAKISFHP